MKFVVALVLIGSFQLFADYCIGEDSFGKEVIGIGGITNEDLIINQDKVLGILNEFKKNNDQRKIYNKNSEEFLETYGKLKIGGVQKCTANIVSDNVENDGVIVTTSAHCFEPGDDNKSMSVEFTKRDGTTIFRNLSMETKNDKHDFAILRLDRKILNRDLKPLVRSEYDSEGLLEEIELDDAEDSMIMTFAGFSADSIAGDGGKNLTYDQNCELTGRVREGYFVETNCMSYPGASGGAVVISYDDYKGVHKDLFVGVHKSGSFNAYDKENPWRAHFVDNAAMYKDIEKALAK